MDIACVRWQGGCFFYVFPSMYYRSVIGLICSLVRFLPLYGFWLNFRGWTIKRTWDPKFNNAFSRREMGTNPLSLTSKGYFAYH
jgi:hypothetical protein